MAFGHWMEVVEGEARVRLGPIRRDDAKRFVAPDAGHGLQSYEVARYLGGFPPPTEQSEEEWWDKTQNDDTKVVWGVHIPDDAVEGGWRLVGSSGLHFHGRTRSRAESGFVLFDRSAWGQRVASTAHLGRTLYAFDELDLLAITSQVFAPNAGSNRALRGIGYVQTGTGYCELTVGGRPVDSNCYLLPNPAEEVWRYFWRRPDGEIPEAFHVARQQTVAALDRAAKAVTFL